MDIRTARKNLLSLAGNPDALWDYVMTLPEDIRKTIVNEMVVTKSKHTDWVRQKERQFTQDYGVSRAWLHALNNPGYLERRRDYAREYQRKRRAALATNDVTNSEISQNATQTNLAEL
jgi:hypothetical protein